MTDERVVRLLHKAIEDCIDDFFNYYKEKLNHDDLSIKYCKNMAKNVYIHVDHTLNIKNNNINKHFLSYFIDRYIKLIKDYKGKKIHIIYYRGFYVIQSLIRYLAEHKYIYTSSVSREKINNLKNEIEKLFCKYENFITQ